MTGHSRKNDAFIALTRNHMAIRWLLDSPSEDLEPVGHFLALLCGANVVDQLERPTQSSESLRSAA